MNIYHLSIYIFLHGHDVGVRDGIGVSTQLTIHIYIYLYIYISEVVSRLEKDVLKTLSNNGVLTSRLKTVS